MITVNFLEGKSRHDGLTAGALFLGFASTALVCLICGWLLLSLHANLREIRKKRDGLSLRVESLRQKTGEISDLERLKSELRHQLLMVATLKRRKRGPAHLLDDVNAALPERAWLTEISEKAGDLQIYGKALDNQTLSDFMRRLSESGFLLNVDLNESKQEMFSGVKVQSFSLKAKALYGGRELPDTLGR